MFFFVHANSIISQTFTKQTALILRCTFCFAVDLDQLGIPKSVAMRLTIPERVTSFNYERMRKIVRTGPNKLGGALYIEKKYDRARFDLMLVNLETVASQLKYGDIVDRMLADGDLVCLNRQPQVTELCGCLLRFCFLYTSSFFFYFLLHTGHYTSSQQVFVSMYS